MLEKEALREAFKSMLPRNFVRIVPNRGWDSITYRTNNICRLYDWKHGENTNDNPKNVYVLYFGDYDPTGVAMSYKIQDCLRPYDINFVRVALNHEHITHYDLDHLRNPDPKVEEKLKRDTNGHRFKKENNGQLFQIELDALEKNPQQFRDLVVNAVDQYYDASIHEENLKEFTPEKITAYVDNKVKFLRPGR
jgi:hypothetical protein